MTGSFTRVWAIHVCLPQRFKDRVEMEDTEVLLWMQIKKTYNMLEVDWVDKRCNNCGKSGHMADNCRSAKEKDDKASNKGA